MALTPEQTDRLIQQADGLAPKEGSIFRALVKLTEAEVRKDDESLILQLVEAMEASLLDMRGLGLISPTAAEHADKHASAITAGRARLEGKP